MLTTTFHLLRKHNACKDRYTVLREALKGRKDNDPITLVEIFDSNGLADALWALQAVPTEQSAERDRLARLYASACVRRVWHLLTDERSRTAVEVAERYAEGAATLDELKTAACAAYDSAACAAYDSAACAAYASAAAAYAAAAYDSAAAAYASAACAAYAAAAYDSAASAAYDSAAYASASAAYDSAAYASASAACAAYASASAAYDSAAYASAAAACAAYAAAAARDSASARDAQAAMFREMFG